MKALFAMLGLALPMFLFNVSAQINVEVSLNQEQYLPGEALGVTVHITNRSGQMLHLGEGDWLTFNVESANGNIVSRKSDPPVKDPFDLDTDEVATKRVNIAPYFTLGVAGTYHVSATVHIKQWNSDITSGQQSFDIIEGAQLWSQSFGVPDPATPNQPPRVRKYTLVEANYLRDQLRLYFQLSDESAGTIVKVHSLGTMISFSQPEAQLDRASNLHVLCQSGATAFTYSVINPNGDITDQHIYDYVNVHPRLTQDNNGDVTVFGGVLRTDSGEIPAVKPPDQLPP